MIIDLREITRDLREITQEDLDGILRKHKEWVESAREKGERADLSETDLRWFNLSGTNLIWANLRGANLIMTDLRGVSLIRADLRGAYLGGADLREADLRESELIKTWLPHTDLRKAKFRGATLSEAYISGADFREADLMAIKIDRKTADQMPDAIQKEYGETWVILEDENLIDRSIEFPPEYHQAGISILNEFASVLRAKYPDTKATIQIKQNGLKVSMTIDPVEGEREVIEKELDRY